MAFQPDPLSVRYERAAGALLGRAIAAPRSWHYVAVSSAGPVDEGGLTRDQRAYQRALYRTAKQMGISVPGGTGMSLRRVWGPETASGRMLGVRLTTAAAARRAVRAKPAGERWSENPALQSAADGSPRQRFG